MSGAVSVQESLSVIEIAGREAAPGQSHFVAHAQGVALVVVQEEQWLRRGKIGQAAGPCSFALGELMGVGQVQLRALEQLGRAHRALPAANARPVEGEREKDAGVADYVVVQKVFGVGAEGVKIQRPSLQWNAQANFVLFVTLA